MRYQIVEIKAQNTHDKSLFPTKKKNELGNDASCDVHLSNG